LESVHEFRIPNSEPLRFGVHHQRIVSREAVERLAAPLFVQVRAGDFDGGVARGDWL
jgi:hypothetical protein